MGPPQITKEAYEEQNIIKFQAQGAKPFKYQWFKDDKKLRDSDDYQGCTTSELHIVDFCSQVKGKYMCQVTNLYGTQEIHYGR